MTTKDRKATVIRRCWVNKELCVFASRLTLPNLQYLSNHVLHDCLPISEV